MKMIEFESIALQINIGLAPSEYSSGEHKRQGHISRQGRSVLRKIIIQASWKAIHKDSSLKIIYERISRTAGKKRAIVSIARRLIGQICSCFRSNELYCFRKTEVIAFCPKTGEILLAASS